MTTVILGGGVSGLSAAYYLRKKLPLHRIILTEGSSRVGGWIKSTLQPNGYIFEQGPRTIRPQGHKGANTLQLIESMGLSSNVRAISKKHPAALNRMIYANGALHTLPNKLSAVFKTHTPFSKPFISYFLNDLSTGRTNIVENDESIYSFVERRFGTDIADYAVSPMICGICAGDAKQISVRFLMEKLFENEQKYGGVIKGSLVDMLLSGKAKQGDFSSKLVKRASEEAWSIYTLDGGLETLPLRLKKYNKRNNVDIILNKTCKSIEFLPSEKVKLTYSDGQVIEADHVISSISAHNLAYMLMYHPPLTGFLQNISFVNVAVVNLFYNSKWLKKEGFGFLVPPKENLSILGVIFDSCFLSANDDKTGLTVMMGGHWFKEQFGDNPSESDLLENALRHVNKILRITEEPAMHSVNILRNCIPQYKVGHKENLTKIENYLQDHLLPLTLCGSSYHGVGINDVILSARAAVESRTRDL